MLATTVLALLSCAPAETVMKTDRATVPVPEMNVGDYTLTLGLMATALSADMWMTPPSEAGWTGGVAVDNDSRKFFRMGDEAGREAAGTASDVLVYGLLAWPLLDASLVAADGRTGDAARMLVIDLQSIFMTETVVNVTKNLVGRERPYVGGCAADDVACHDPDSRKSFMSGHTARAFTAAGLICTQHGELDLWGGGAADSVACALATTAAGSVGILRMMADRHYATDVLGGAAVGILSGFVMPRVLHFGWGGDDEPKKQVSIRPVVGDDFMGATAGGVF